MRSIHSCKFSETKCDCRTDAEVATPIGANRCGAKAAQAPRPAALGLDPYRRRNDAQQPAAQLAHRRGTASALKQRIALRRSGACVRTSACNGSPRRYASLARHRSDWGGWHLQCLPVHAHEAVSTAARPRWQRHVVDGLAALALHRTAETEQPSAGPTRRLCDHATMFGRA